MCCFLEFGARKKWKEKPTEDNMVANSGEGKNLDSGECVATKEIKKQQR